MQEGDNAEFLVVCLASRVPFTHILKFFSLKFLVGHVAPSRWSDLSDGKKIVNGAPNFRHTIRESMSKEKPQ